MTLLSDVTSEHATIHSRLQTLTLEAEKEVRQSIISGTPPSPHVVALTPQGEVAYHMEWRNEWEQSKIFSSLTAELAKDETFAFLIILPGTFFTTPAYFFHAIAPAWRHTRVLRYRETPQGVAWAVVEDYPDFKFPSLSLPSMH